MILKTVGDLQGVMTTHPDVGVAMAIQQAIRHAKEKKGLTSETTLNAETLEKIRQSIYDTNNMDREYADPKITFLNATLSTTTIPGKGSGNKTDDTIA